MYNVTVNTHALHVRQQARFQSPPVAWIHKGDKFTASKVQNGWYYIDAKGGWSNGTYLDVTEKPKPQPPPPPKPTPPPKVEEKDPPPEEPPGPPPPPSRTIKVDPTLKASNNMIDLNGQALSTGPDSSDTRMLDSMHSTPSPTQEDVPATHSLMTASTRSRVTIIPESFATSYGSRSFSEPYGNFQYLMRPDQEIVNLSNNLNVIRHNLNIWNDKDPGRLFSRFNRFKIPMPDNTLNRIIPYVFFTRPSLNVIDPNSGELKPQFRDDPLFTHIMATNPDILHSLGESLSSTHKFNTFLSNSARSFEPQDEIIRTTQTGETYTGWKMIYGRNTNESNTAGQFNIQYQDNRDADIYRMHKAWITYINNVYRGIWKVREVTLMRKILNYASSLYYVVCAGDGETILYWVKYYGVFPINTPASSMSWSSGTSPGMVDFVINYVYSMKEDYNPIALSEFNSMSEGSMSYKPIYDRRIKGTTPSMSGTPFIDQTTNPGGRRVYKLRFRN